VGNIGRNESLFHKFGSISNRVIDVSVGTPHIEQSRKTQDVLGGTKILGSWREAVISRPPYVHEVQISHPGEVLPALWKY